MIVATIKFSAALAELDVLAKHAPLELAEKAWKQLRYATPNDLCAIEIETDEWLKQPRILLVPGPAIDRAFAMLKPGGAVNASESALPASPSERSV